MMRASLLLWLGGCAADLLPGESVLGDEVPAVIVEGTAGSQLGAAVAIGWDADGERSILVAAPGAGEVRALNARGRTEWTHEGEPGLGTRVGWADGVPWAWSPGLGILRLDGQPPASDWSLPGATAVDVCADGTPRSVTGRGEDVVCGDELEARTTCQGAQCDVERITAEGVSRVGTTSAGSALAIVDGELCWGDARLGKETAPGGIQCESDQSRRGLDGDHLGLSIGGARTAGVFNRHITPPRARIVPLDGGEVWVVDRAAEGSRIHLAGSAGLTVVGVPGFGAQQAEEGRVYIIQERG